LASYGDSLPELLHYHIDMVYACNIIKGQKLEYNKDELKGIGFFGISDIQNLPMFPNFKNLLSIYLSESQ